MILKLTRKQVETLKKDAIRNYPEEACAMLFGKTEKGIAEVSWIHRIRSLPYQQL